MQNLIVYNITNYMPTYFTTLHNGCYVRYNIIIQFSISCSSILCFDGLRLLTFIKATTSLYLACHLSSCVIILKLSRILRQCRNLVLCTAVLPATLLLITLFNHLPIHNLPQRSQVVRPAILIVQIVRVTCITTWD